MGVVDGLVYTYGGLYIAILKLYTVNDTTILLVPESALHERIFDEDLR